MVWGWGGGGGETTKGKKIEAKRQGAKRVGNVSEKSDRPI